MLPISEIPISKKRVEKDRVYGFSQKFSKIVDKAEKKIYSETFIKIRDT